MIHLVKTEDDPSGLVHAPVGARVAETRGEVNSEMLRSFVDRLTSLAEQRAAMGEDIADVYSEAKSQGFDKAALKTVVKIAMEGADKRVKRRETDDDATGVYLAALGLS